MKSMLLRATAATYEKVRYRSDGLAVIAYFYHPRKSEGKRRPVGPGMKTATTIWPDFEERRNEIISRRSAIQWSERLGVPLLLMHGSRDRDVSPTQTLRLATQLAKTQREFSVIIFPGGDHILQQHRVEHDRAVVEFFRRYFKR